MTPRLLIVALPLVFAADWPQFRGPGGTGVTSAPTPPAAFTAADVAWAVKVPGSGWAQPLAMGKTVYVQTAVSDPPLTPKSFLAGVIMPQSRGGQAPPPPDVVIDWQLIALDLDSGKTKWARSVAKGKPKQPIHPSNSYATETPVAVTSNLIVSYFGATGTLAGFDAAGAELWKQELGVGPTTNGFGTGSSPTTFAGKVYVMQFNEEVARLVCFAAATGKQLWEVKRDKPGTTWASPLAWRQGTRTDIVCCGRGLVTGHDPATGEEVWRVGGLDSSFSSSPAAMAERLYFGSSGPGTVAPLYAIKAGATGDCTLKKGDKDNEWVAWMKTGAGPGFASPIAQGDKVYILGNRGLSCYDATGKELYRERLPKTGTIAASPFLAGDTLFAVDEAGHVVAVKPDPPFEVLGQSKIDDTVWSSPTPIPSGLLIRGVDKLHCVKK